MQHITTDHFVSVAMNLCPAAGNWSQHMCAAGQKSIIEKDGAGRLHLCPFFSLPKVGNSRSCPALCPFRLQPDHRIGVLQGILSSASERSALRMVAVVILVTLVERYALAEVLHRISKTAEHKLNVLSTVYLKKEACLQRVLQADSLRRGRSQFWPRLIRRLQLRLKLRPGRQPKYETGWLP